MNTAVDNLTYQRPKSWEPVEYHSEWKDHSQFRVRIRHILETNKYIVDMTELSYGDLCHDANAARRLAFDRVQKFGVACADNVTLCDYRADKKTSRFDGTVGVVKIRQCSYVFSGVE